MIILYELLKIISLLFTFVLSLRLLPCFKLKLIKMFGRVVLLCFVAFLPYLFPVASFACSRESNCSDCVSSHGIRCSWCKKDNQCHMPGTILTNPCKKARENIVHISHCSDEIPRYNPEISYKMLLLSAVAFDSIHPRQCLDNSLPSAKFQLQTVVTRKCDFVDNKCSGYVAVSHAMRALVIAFRGTVSYNQLFVELLETLLVPKENFLKGKVQTYWKRGFETLWKSMGPKVKTLVSRNPSYQIWVTGHSMGAAMASLASAWLAYHSIAPRENIILYTFGMPRVGDYKYALQHDQLVKNSWRVVNYDDIVPHLPPLIEPDITSGPYHHGVEVFYSVIAVSVNSTHRECHGTPYDEDKTCSRKQATVNLRRSIERHKKYFSIRVSQFCVEASLNYSSEKTFQGL